MQLQFTVEASESYTIPLPLHSGIKFLDGRKFACAATVWLFPSTAELAESGAWAGETWPIKPFSRRINKVACSAEELTQRRLGITDWNVRFWCCTEPPSHVP